MLTKAEEKKALEKLVGKLPEGYAKSILSELLPAMGQAIDSDFAFIPFRSAVDQQAEIRAELAEGRKKIEAMKAEIRQLERDRETLSNGIESLRNTVRALSRI